MDTSRGGMFVFVTLPPGMDAAALPPAMERGVVYVPGASFLDAAQRRDRAGGANTLRLNFVSANEAAIRRGIRLLVDTLRETTLEG